MSRLNLGVREGARRWRAPLAGVALPSLALLFGFAATLTGTDLSVPNVTVGRNLQVSAILSLKGAAPAGGFQVKITSDQPKRLLLSRAPDREGSPEITVPIGEGRNSSGEYYLQALADSGTATYTASVAGAAGVKGTVTLTPSGIVIGGPAGLGNPLLTTSGAGPSRISVFSAQLDSAGTFVAEQPVRGGFSPKIHLTSSDPLIATIPQPDLTIAGGTFGAVTGFQPAGAGTIQVSASVPEGFSAPATFGSLTAQMTKPKLGVTEQVNLGRDLEIGGQVLLGELAPAAGLTVTLTSGDPSKLLLSQAPLDPGAKSIVIKIPAGAFRGPYFLHGLGDSGPVTYTATAPGFQSREGTIHLTPSGVIITGPIGTPDEAELFRPKDPVGPNGFFTKLSDPNPTQVVVYTVQLDPVTHRCADITVQSLRSGLSLNLQLTNENEAVGTIPTAVAIQGGFSQGFTKFTPRSAGTTSISVNTPAGFTTPTNATKLKAVVTQ